MIDFPGALYDPIYIAMSSSAELTPGGTGVPVTISVMDQTKGIMIMSAKTGIQTIRPACCIRGRELVSNNIELADLKGGTIRMWPDTADEKEWRIEDYSVMPSPSGNLAGEVQLILIKVP